MAVSVTAGTMRSSRISTARGGCRRGFLAIGVRLLESNLPIHEFRPNMDAPFTGKSREAEYLECSHFSTNGLCPLRGKVFEGVTKFPGMPGRFLGATEFRAKPSFPWFF